MMYQQGCDANCSLAVFPLEGGACGQRRALRIGKGDRSASEAGNFSMFTYRCTGYDAGNSACNRDRGPAKSINRRNYRTEVKRSHEKGIIIFGDIVRQWVSGDAEERVAGARF
jgi:hypothetical protein